MNVKDYYKTLGVDKNASQDEIKKAYRKLARQYHPDANQGDKAAEDRFKEVNEAYEVLSDPQKREKYNQFGAEWEQYERMGGQPGGFNWSQWASQPGGGTYTRRVSPEEFESMFGGGRTGGAGSGFSDFFEMLFGRGGGFSSSFGGGYDDASPRAGTRQRQRVQAGRDMEQPVEITLEEAFHGTHRTLRYDSGRTIDAHIPPGVRTGSRVRLRGQGEPGAGGPAGDLYLNITVQPHTTFERDGDDLRRSVPVDLFTALLGGSVPVHSIDKTVNLTIPPGTQNGRVFRLSGLGMPRTRNRDQRGDLYATVDVRLPEQLNDDEKRLLEQLRDLHAKSSNPV